MDAISTAASIVGVLDVLTRSILKLYEIQKKLQETNITLAALIGELTATKAALRELQATVDEHASQEQHYDLAIELDSSLSCCRLMVDFVETRISPVVRASDDSLGPKLPFKQQVNLILADQETSNCLSRLSRIISALSIVKHGLERRTVHGQQAVIHDTHNRWILESIREDSSSLKVVWDQASMKTQASASTLRSSILQRTFGVDRELLQHRAYQATFRSLIKRVGTRHSRSVHVNCDKSGLAQKAPIESLTSIKASTPGLGRSFSSESRPQPNTPRRRRPRTSSTTPTTYPSSLTSSNEPPKSSTSTSAQLHQSNTMPNQAAKLLPRDERLPSMHYLEYLSLADLRDDDAFTSPLYPGTLKPFGPGSLMSALEARKRSGFFNTAFGMPRGDAVVMPFIEADLIMWGGDQIPTSLLVQPVSLPT